MDGDSARCRTEIAAIEAELLAGNPDLQGLLLALSDWSAELRILQRGSGGPHAEESPQDRKTGGGDAAEWFDQSAMDVLLEQDFQVAEKDGAAKSDVGRAFGLVKINLPAASQEVTRETFTFRLDKVKLKQAELRDGHYLLRTNLVAEDPAVLRDRYMQLTQIEAAFKCLKSDLGIRPIHHQLEHRVEAHILVAFLAYCLSVTLKHRLKAHAPGLTPRALLEKLAAIQMLDVSFPTTNGRRLVMPRYTEPSPEQALLLHQLKLVLPQQPPPPITTPASSGPFSQLKM